MRSRWLRIIIFQAKNQRTCETRSTNKQITITVSFIKVSISFSPHSIPQLSGLSNRPTPDTKIEKSKNKWRLPAVYGANTQLQMLRLLANSEVNHYYSSDTWSSQQQSVKFTTKALWTASDSVICSKWTVSFNFVIPLNYCWEFYSVSHMTQVSRLS